jgi:hypothetical protein
MSCGFSSSPPVVSSFRDRLKRWHGGEGRADDARHAELGVDEAHRGKRAGRAIAVELRDRHTVLRIFFDRPVSM